MWLTIVLAIALGVALYFVFFGSSKQSPSPELQKRLEAGEKTRQQLETELEKKRRDLEESKAQLAELKDELKTTKRKLFEQREADKSSRDLFKARAEAEQQASVQLETVRAELAAALHEVERLRTDAEARGRRSTPVQAAPQTAVETSVSGKPAAHEPSPTRVIRELSPAERERIDRLEQQVTRERNRSMELDREARRLKRRVETQNRVYLVAKGESELVKDKFKALEKRLNRILLESDLLRRALATLEKSSGIAASRTELTADELAASDRRIEEQQAREEAELKARDAAAATPLPSETEVEENLTPDVERVH